MANPEGRERGDRAPVLWIVGLSALGLVVLGGSFVLRDVDQWSSDATMSLGFSILLVLPIYFITKHLDRRAERRLDETRAAIEADVEAEVGGLRRSIGEAQSALVDELMSRDDELRDLLRAMVNDVTHAGALRSFRAARDAGLLSPLGLRADAHLNDFYLRVVLDPNDQLAVHLDTMHSASEFSAPWDPGQAFDDVMLTLAEDVKRTPYWPGPQRWEFRTAWQTIADTLITAVDMRADGEWIRNIVQRVGGWVLTDTETRPIDRSYQILYTRLDHLNWYMQLHRKSWVDPDDLDQMLETAEFLRDLAASTGS